MNYTINKIAQIFSCDKKLIRQQQKDGLLPKFTQGQQSWSGFDAPLVGEKLGFLKPPPQAVAASIFVTKGGVLKTSLTLNIARAAALHNIKTCVVGLDLQGDITTALGFEREANDSADLSEALRQLEEIQGLPDYFHGHAGLEDIILPTDLASLSFIPETPELVSLEKQLFHRPRREYWLKDNLIEPLKKKFDLILLDAPPNWNQLITNALVASDFLISPLECKINNFRNYKMFAAFIEEFRKDMKLGFKNHFVPTRLTAQRRLSREICDWYKDNVAHCSSVAIRESLQGEESMAMNLSILEYQPASLAALEMRRWLEELWPQMMGHQPSPSLTPAPQPTNQGGFNGFIARSSQ